MKSVIKREGQTVSIRLPQRFVYTETEELKEYCLALLISGEDIHFYISFVDCEFIDSSGLGALVSIYKQCLDQNVGIILSSMSNRQVREIFRLTKLDRIFTID